MRKNFGAKSWLFPMPVLMVATYDENGVPDIMNAAWGGIHDTNQIGVCIAPEHRTAKNMVKCQAFTVSAGTAEYVAACDYVGLVSGNKEPSKAARAGFHFSPSALVHAPIPDELPFTLECRLLSYDNKTGCTVGEIVNVSADASILDDAGNMDPEKFSPLCFDPVRQVYCTVGRIAGQAFRDGKTLMKKEQV